MRSDFMARLETVRMLVRRRPLSIVQLAARMKCSVSTARSCVQVLHGGKEIHIGEWSRGKKNVPVARYLIGQKADVKNPEKLPRNSDAIDADTDAPFMRPPERPVPPHPLTDVWMGWERAGASA